MTNMTTSIFKIIPHTDNDASSLIDRLNYIRNPAATTSELTVSEFVSKRYPYDEMMMAKRCHESDGNRTMQGQHFHEYVISIPEEESENLEAFHSCISAITGYLSRYDGGHYQAIACIHTNTDNLHAHIIVNNIDFQTGARINTSYKDLYEMRSVCTDFLKRHRFSGITDSTTL